MTENQITRNEDPEMDGENIEENNGEVVKKNVFSRIDFFKISSTIHHGQLRDLLKTVDNESMHFISSKGKVSNLNYKNGGIIENVIPMEMMEDNKVVYSYFKTSNYFFWSYENTPFLYAHHEKSKLYFEKSTSPIANEINAIDVTKDERFVFVGGQMSSLLVYSIDEIDGFKLLQSSSQELGSYANDVKLSPDNKYLAAVTDSTEFHIFEVCIDKKKENVDLVRLYGKEDYENAKKFRGTGDMCDWSCDSRRLAIALESSVVVYDMKKREAELNIETPDCSIVKWSPVRPEILVFASDMDDKGETYILNLHLQRIGSREKVVTNEYDEKKVFDRTDFEVDFDDYVPGKIKDDEIIKKTDISLHNLSFHCKKEYFKKNKDEDEQQQLKVQCMGFSRDGEIVITTFRRYVYSDGSHEEFCYMSVGYLLPEFHKKKSVWEILEKKDFEERTTFLFSQREDIFAEDDERSSGVSIILEGWMIENIPLTFLIL